MRIQKSEQEWEMKWNFEVAMDSLNRFWEALRNYNCCQTHLLCLALLLHSCVISLLKLELGRHFLKILQKLYSKQIFHEICLSNRLGKLVEHSSVCNLAAQRKLRDASLWKEGFC
jgi:hypothetical protein